MISSHTFNRIELENFRNISSLLFAFFHQIVRTCKLDTQARKYQVNNNFITYMSLRSFFANTIKNTHYNPRGKF